MEDDTVENTVMSRHLPDLEILANGAIQELNTIEQ